MNFFSNNIQINKLSTSSNNISFDKFKISNINKNDHNLFNSFYIFINNITNVNLKLMFNL